LTLGGSAWSYGGGNLVSSLVNPGALVVKLKTVGNYRVDRRLSVVCPAGTFVSASGCFNCDLGFRIKLVLHSYCEKGTVLVTTDDSSVILWTNAVALDVLDANFTINGATTKASNDFDLIIGSASNQLKINVVFTASEDINIHNQSNINGDGTDIDKPRDLPDIPDVSVSWFQGIADFFNGIGQAIDNVFKGIGSFLDCIKTVAVFIVLIIAVVLVVPTSIWIVKSISSAAANMNFKKKVM
jgi:hypothetical protein